MTLVRVPTVQTKSTPAEMIKGFTAAWFELYGILPKKESIGVIFGQWSLETGQGKACWNYNIGNIKAKDIPGQTIEYVALVNVWEIVNGKKIILDKENPGSWFRAFRTLKDGAKYHFEFLRSQRYKIAWQAVEAGNPDDFAAKLRQQGYYTAPLADYQRALKSYYNVYMKSNYFEQAVQALNIVAPGAESIQQAPDFNHSIGNIEFDRTFNSQEDNAPIQLTTWQKVQSFFFKLLK